MMLYFTLGAGYFFENFVMLNICGFYLGFLFDITRNEHSVHLTNDFKLLLCFYYKRNLAYQFRQIIDFEIYLLFTEK